MYEPHYWWLEAPWAHLDSKVRKKRVEKEGHLSLDMGTFRAADCDHDHINPTNLSGVLAWYKLSSTMPTTWKPQASLQSMPECCNAFRTYFFDSIAAGQGIDTIMDTVLRLSQPQR